MERGVELRKQISTDAMLRDIAGRDCRACRVRKIGIVGYCLGGSLAWLSAGRLQGLAAAIGYYGGTSPPILARSRAAR